MGTREMCGKCGEFFIIGQESDSCPHRQLEDGEPKALRNCHDCGVKPGQIHKDGCDVERCSVCGGQRLGDECKGHDKAFARWTGIWPGEAEAVFLGVDLNEPTLKDFFVKPDDEPHSTEEEIDKMEDAEFEISQDLKMIDGREMPEIVPIWCSCGDSMENCHEEDEETEAHAAAVKVGITDENELWMTYYCFGCDKLFTLKER